MSHYLSVLLTKKDRGIKIIPWFMEKWNTILLYFGSFAWFAHTFSNVVFKIQGAQIRSDRKVVWKCTSADAPKACQPNRLMRFMDSTSVCLCSFRHKPQYETPSRTHSVPTGWIYIFFVLHITPCFFISLTIPIFAEDMFEKEQGKTCPSLVPHQIYCLFSVKSSFMSSALEAP